ncbi:Trp biosynthesis-associated membrane protein [Planobispora rosea]|uniref:Trp biosynthesis-associated membrane protein n=1 Tax=Planobispora rosea TaxID=35762 RepID=UPI0016713AA4|nr:Trp biosynthesis-associated membrane protein [Planobispora rosea]
MSGANARRALWAWVLTCAAGAGLVLLAAGRGWATLDAGGSRVGGGSQRVTLTGAELVPFLNSIALAAFAAVVAVLATRGWPRRAVGAVIALCGLGAVAGTWSGIRPSALAAAALDRLTSARLPGTDSAGDLLSTEVHWAWPPAAAAGGLVLLAGGVAAVLRGGRWPGMSARYDRPGTGSGGAGDGPAGPATDRALWDAIDGGADPTADPVAGPVTAPAAGPESGGPEGSGAGDGPGSRGEGIDGPGNGDGGGAPAGRGGRTG